MLTTQELFNTPITLDQWLLSIERSRISEVLRQSMGNEALAARSLGITYRALRFRLQNIREWFQGFKSNWPELKRITLEKYGRTCLACGSDNRICVDHVKPREHYPWLAHDPNNLQVLCEKCNRAKGSKIVDYRP